MNLAVDRVPVTSSNNHDSSLNRFLGRNNTQNSDASKFGGRELGFDGLGERNE